jgi:hydroxyacylglutathione hydrolase
VLFVTPVKAFETNYIWLIHNQRHAVIVDPGMAAPVQAALKQMGLTPVAVLITHHHGDHVDGIDAWEDSLPIYGPSREEIPGVSHPVGEGDRIEIEALGLELAVLDLPGHTRGHVGYVGHGWLFCGDTLFAGGCGRVFEGTPAQMHYSLERLGNLPPQTEVYCAHEYTEANLAFAWAVEPDNRELAQRMAQVKTLRQANEPTLPSTIGLERATNPFLRCSQPGVIEAISQHCGQPLQDPVQVFAQMREWKNQF